MLAKEGWVVVYDLKQRWREVYAVLRIDNDTQIITVQYYKKPGEFEAAGRFSFGVSSTVEVFEPPHVFEKGWPSETVARLKLGTDERLDKKKDEYVLFSTSVRYDTEGVGLAAEPHSDVSEWAALIKTTLKSWWERVATSPVQLNLGTKAAASDTTDAGVRAAVEVVFATNDFLMSGWLWKEGGRWRNWKRRWFELTTISFSYYDVPEGKVLGDIPVRSGTVIEWEQEATKRKMRYSFHVMTPSRVYHVYTPEKAEFDKWEAAFKTMGCVVKQFEKMQGRQRSGSLSRVKLAVLPTRTPSHLAPEPGPLSGKFSKSSTDLPSESRARLGSTFGASPPQYKARTTSTSQRLKRLAQTPIARPDNVYGQSQFKSFEDFHRFLCPVDWRGAGLEVTLPTPMPPALTTPTLVVDGGDHALPEPHPPYDAITTM
eukprot:m.167390 g.167390  ORF g.167390 m.167390 type:complete len:429 (-) comp24098_c0_seq1:791-2077(-)